MLMYKRENTRGFTIVELLIVVVIIAILAAITIVAYNGIQQRARASAASSALSQAAKKLELYKVDNSAYPTSTNLASAGITNANDTTYQYTSDGTTYCLTATNVTISYYLNSTTTSSPTAGGCPGHGVGGNNPITNLVVNPSAEDSTNGWGYVADTGVVASARLTTGGYSGPGFYRITYSTAPTGTSSIWLSANSVSLSDAGGKSFTASAYVRTSWSGGVFALNLVPYNSSWVYAGGEVYGSNITVGANTWTRLNATISSSPSATAYFVLRVRMRGGTLPLASSTIDADASLLTQGSTLYNYADGSSPNWVWNGTANASTSTGPAL